MNLPVHTEILSLFCGAGGLDAGFEDAGFSAPIAFDIRPDAIASFNHNRIQKSGAVADVRDITLTDLDVAYGKEFKPIGIIGGPPCQSFSVSNVHSKGDDPRHELPLHYARIISELNARNPIHFFVFENVTGLLNAKHNSRYDNFLLKFSEAGFNVFPEVVNAVDYNVPQNRKRVFVVGLNKLIYPDAKWRKPDPISETISVRDAISDLPDPAYYSKKLTSDDIPHHVNHWCMTPRSQKFSTPGALVPGRKGRSFRTLDWDKASPTVAYGHREVHVHPNGKRRLSIYEAMVLQGFDKSYELLGNLSSQIQQISEAVPPPLAYSIACSIKSILNH